MLKVLVTGFPNSGTSFLMELCTRATNLNPGSNLKGPDNHNPYGYWEHLPIRNTAWSIFGGGFRVRAIPHEPYQRDEGVASDILTAARQDNVEIYKDPTLPLIYRSFPGDMKIAVIHRSLRRVYERYYSDRMSLSCFSEYHYRYTMLARGMKNDHDVAFVRYESFGSSFDAQASELCDFLGVPYREELREVWRPRKQS